MKPARPKSRRQPMQPIVVAGDGVIRFQENEVVRMLLDCGNIDLNKLTIIARDAHRDDWEQFAQLIGYSVSGFGGLSYASKETVAAADELARKFYAKTKEGGE